MALERNFLLSMQFWTWWTEYHTKKHGQENVYIYMAFSSILRKPLILYWNHTISLDRLQHYGITGILHKWLSSRILLWNENNSYREWAYIIQEEISNLSSTRVRFGTFVDLHSRQCNRSACRVKKCTTLVGQWQLNQCIAKARASRSSLHRNIQD